MINAKAKLIIEIDGSQHYSEEGLEYDSLRSEIINKYGVEVIRFSNYDIDNNFGVDFGNIKFGYNRPKVTKELQAIIARELDYMTGINILAIDLLKN